MTGWSGNSLVDQNTQIFDETFKKKYLSTCAGCNGVFVVIEAAPYSIYCSV